MILIWGDLGYSFNGPFLGVYILGCLDSNKTEDS